MDTVDIIAAVGILIIFLGAFIYCHLQFKKANKQAKKEKPDEHP